MFSMISSLIWRPNFASKALEENPLVHVIISSSDEQEWNEQTVLPLFMR